MNVNAREDRRVVIALDGSAELGVSLARFHFGRFAETATDGVDLPVTLDTVDGSMVQEDWQVAGPVTSGADGDLRFCVSPDHLLLALNVPLDGPADRVTQAVYTRLLTQCVQRGFPHLVKCWNHVPDINQGDGDRERYRRFCEGRARAFDRCFPGAGRIPAATAVGAAADKPLQVFLLACRAEPEHLGNPRQMDAFEYPRQYGPRSPTFARASLLGQRLFVSGTAAIVGHESQHGDNLEAQITETMTNWRTLLSRAADRAGRPPPTLSEVPSFRVYVRQPRCLDLVRRLLRAAGVNDQHAIYLNAEICRRELLFELDGLAEVA